MPEPTPTYPAEQFARFAATCRMKAAQATIAGEHSNGRFYEELGRLLTFAQGLAQENARLTTLVEDVRKCETLGLKLIEENSNWPKLKAAREQIDQLTRALAAKTQELADAREHKADELHLCAGFQNRIAALEQQLATVRGVLFEVVSTLSMDMGRAADAGYASRFSHLRKAVVQALKELQRIAELGDGPGPAPEPPTEPRRVVLLLDDAGAGTQIGPSPGPALAPQDHHVTFGDPNQCEHRNMPNVGCSCLGPCYCKIHGVCRNVERPAAAAGGAASPSFDELLDQAVRHKGRPKDVEAWAKKLAEDSVKAGEIEAGGVASPAPRMSAEALAVIADDIADMADCYVQAHDAKSLRNSATNLARMIRIHVGGASPAPGTQEK